MLTLKIQGAKVRILYEIAIKIHLIFMPKMEVYNLEEQSIGKRQE
jgi:hypothetical protein